MCLARGPEAGVSSTMRPFVLLMLAPVVAAAEWTAGTWRGESAWVAEHRGWTAVVCPAWGRLVALRTPAGDEVLHVSDAANLAGTTGGVAGGHQAWLGPQDRWGWPPPAHWEYRGAERVRRDGGTLELVLPAGADARWPALTRVYRWTDAGLRLAVRWRCDVPLHALHVLQLRGDALVRLRPQPREGLPAGFAARTGDGSPPLAVDLGLPQPCVEAEGDRVRLRRGLPFQKLFFPLQPVVADLGRWRLVLTRAEHIGAADGEPDGGLVTQAFLGAPWDMVEIEQASPLLHGAGELESAVLLRCEAVE